jgi:SAM-dependent methyltransferase
MNEQLPVAAVPDTWQRGSPYERYMGRWSRPVAREFLQWLRVPPSKRWLDVGCGTGALCEAILEHCAPSSVVGVEPSDGFRDAAAAALADRADVRAGSATSLPLADGAVDVTVSGLVLNFVPDLGAALAEMRRVTSPGGTIAAYVWDYADRMELVRHFWDAACELDPAASKLHEGRRFPLCSPDALQAQLGNAGLLRPQVAPLEVPTHFASFQEYWEPFLGGQGPAPAYAMALTEERRARLCDLLRARLPTRADGSIGLVARAWAVRASVPDLG